MQKGSYSSSKASKEEEGYQGKLLVLILINWFA